MLLVLPWVAHAAGLGKLTILSALGGPLLAEVELISVQEDERATLKARIASPEAFKQANVQYSPALVGVRLSIERRSDGRPYLKIISTRPVNEPFIDLLVELNWAQGHLVREYTALIDPAGFTPGAPIVEAVPPVELAPVVALESQALAPAAPVEAKPAAKAPAVKRPAAAPARAQSKAYGPVERGDTLSRIAASVKPKGITLEQMLVSLYHANRDAFGANMNVLKTGAILRIPEEQEVAATAQSEATKEVRAQAAGMETPKEARVQAAGMEAPKEVLKLSNYDPTVSGRTDGKGAPRQVTERLRALEAEVDSLDKALTEANQLVVQLEQTVKTMRRRIEVAEQLPGLSAAGTLPPAPGAKPGAAPPVKGDQVAQTQPARAEPAKTEPAKMESARDTGQLTAPAPGSGEKAVPAAQPAAAGPAQGEALKAEAPKAGAGAPTQRKPKPTEIIQAPPDMLDQILAEPLYLAGGGLLALLGVAGYWFARRRRTQIVDVDPLAANDPLAEAELFLGFGRDHQAEEILKEVLEGDPANEAAKLKLSQIYARRNDKAAPEKIAHNVQTQTIGAINSSLVAPLGEMARAVEAQDIARDAGAAHAAAEAESAVAAPDSTLKFPDGMQPPAATEAAPAVAAPDSTLKFPDGMQPPAAPDETPAAPDETPAAPGGEAVKTGVTDEPAAPMIGTIDFYTTAPAPATPGDDKDSTRDDSIIPVSRKP